MKAKIAKVVQSVFRVVNPLRWLRRGWFALGNLRRRRRKIEYVALTLPSSLPPLPEARPWWQRRVMGDSPLSLLELDRFFEQVGRDPRPKGVILVLRGLNMPLADLETLRGSLLRLRQTGKRVICFAQDYDNATYFIASAADEIVLQPGGSLNTVGLLAQAVFLKDALNTLGVEAEAIAISPYKTALDRLANSDLSPESREQLNSLLDSQFDILTGGIAAGRKVSPEAVRTMIDNAPHLDSDALAAGYVDSVENEEALYRRLASEHVLTLKQARKTLLRQWRKPAQRYVALLRVGGLIVSGESGSPPVDIPIPIIGGERMGDLTVVRQVRNLMQDQGAAAVILFVDSGGGSASASEAMASALDELAQNRPLVVYMNSVAASGGYYIATPAHWIVAQPGTITGSIGVISGKIITDGLWERLHVNRVQLARGANADLFGDSGPMTDNQRAKLRAGIEHTYQQFGGRVAASRKMPFEAVDAVGGGRVWTGQQAIRHGLVDELGGVDAALNKARELANLPDDAPLAIFQGKGRPLLPQLAEKADPTAGLRYLHENLRGIFNGSAQLLLPFWWE
ncbi:MAG: S49 family peptidase [Anaerolineaceae bacterium]|nr:S49 family peptidase [Anaerolineaceae bacterium]